MRENRNERNDIRDSIYASGQMLPSYKWSLSKQVRRYHLKQKIDHTGTATSRLAPRLTWCSAQFGSAKAQYAALFLGSFSAVSKSIFTCEGSFVSSFCASQDHYDIIPGNCDFPGQLHLFFVEKSAEFSQFSRNEAEMFAILAKCQIICRKSA